MEIGLGARDQLLYRRADFDLALRRQQIAHGINVCALQHIRKRTHHDVRTVNCSLTLEAMHVLIANTRLAVNAQQEKL